MKIKSKIRERGRYKIIDKVSAKLNEHTDRYEGTIFNINITLRTGMQMAMPQFVGSRLPKHTHILQQQRIHTNAVEFAYHLKRILHLMIIDDGVHRNMNLGSKLL